MIILPAIDIIDGCAVRLFKGDYAQKTVYGTDPAEIALDFKRQGAEFIHLVDLDGAKSGKTDNFVTVSKIIGTAGVSCEIGGGIRDMDTVEKYMNAGAARVILGTAAANDPQFVKTAVSAFGDKIAVGVDIKDGFVAVKGWTEKTDLRAESFILEMKNIGVKTFICTDISKDGAMRGTNLALYQELSAIQGVNITASGGVSSMEDVTALKKIGVHAAIIGKAYYTGAIDLKTAIEVAK